jgi:hypothetical protein
VQITPKTLTSHLLSTSFLVVLADIRLDACSQPRAIADGGRLDDTLDFFLPLPLSLGPAREAIDHPLIQAANSWAETASCAFDAQSVKV